MHDDSYCFSVCIIMHTKPTFVPCASIHCQCLRQSWKESRDCWQQTSCCTISQLASFTLPRLPCGNAIWEWIWKATSTFLTMCRSLKLAEHRSDSASKRKVFFAGYPKCCRQIKSVCLNSAIFFPIHKYSRKITLECWIKYQTFSTCLNIDVGEQKLWPAKGTCKYSVLFLAYCADTWQGDVKLHWICIVANMQEGSIVGLVGFAYLSR